jgi:RNA polymerase sigma factor (sigma-70 family)
MLSSRPPRGGKSGREFLAPHFAIQSVSNPSVFLFDRFTSGTLLEEKMAKAKDRFDEFLESEFVKKTVAQRAWRLRGMFDEPCPDVEDFEQDLMVYLVKGIRKHDPERGTLEAFAITILDSKKWNIIRKMNAKMRREEDLVYIDEEFKFKDSNFGDDADPEVHSVVDERDAHRHSQIERRSQNWGDRAKHDLQTAMAALPPVLLDLAQRLKTKKPAEIAEDLGVPLSTICDRQKQIMKVFERFDLAKYLGDRP